MRQSSAEAAVPSTQGVGSFDREKEHDAGQDRFPPCAVLQACEPDPGFQKPFKHKSILQKMARIQSLDQAEAVPVTQTDVHEFPDLDHSLWHSSGCLPQLPCGTRFHGIILVISMLDGMGCLLLALASPAGITRKGALCRR